MKGLNVSGIVGLGFLVVTVGPALVFGGQPLVFVNLPSLILCVCFPVALGIMSFGLHDTMRGVWALRMLVVQVPPQDLSVRQAAVLRGLIGPVYAAALVGFVIGVIQMLVVLDDFSKLGYGIGIALLCPFYSVLLAECVLRPAVKAIEHGKRAPQPTAQVEMA